MSIENKYNYVFDEIAEKNLSDIFNYVSNNLSNPKAANELYEDFFKAIEQIREMPKCGEERDKEKGTRRIPIKNYILYYIPLHDRKVIYIIKITHAKQKFENENI